MGFLSSFLIMRLFDLAVFELWRYKFSSVFYSSEMIEFLAFVDDWYSAFSLQIGISTAIAVELLAIGCSKHFRESLLLLLSFESRLESRFLFLCASLFLLSDGSRIARLDALK